MIVSPDYVVIKAADEFTDKTKAIDEMRQTEFTEFKIMCRSWYHLVTIPGDFSRYIKA